MRLLVISPNMNRYRGAFYQSDFLEELSRQADCFFWGPGFESYNYTPAETKRAVKNFDADAILFSHSYLADSPDLPIEAFGIPNWFPRNLPRFLFLNKEYARLADKLAWCEQNEISHVFSHHQRFSSLANSEKVEYTSIPFGVSLRRFRIGIGDRPYDLGFSGILKNPTHSEKQDSNRLKFQSSLFATWNKVPVLRRRAARNLQLTWHVWTGKPFLDIFAKALLGQGPLSESEYVEKLQRSKMWLNFLSPLDLIGTRFLECMASGTLVITPVSSDVEMLFGRDTHVQVESAEHFLDSVERLSQDNGELNRISEIAHKEVLKRHTWEVRVRHFLSVIANKI